MSTNNTLNVRHSIDCILDRYLCQIYVLHLNEKMRQSNAYELMIVFCFRLWWARWSLLHDFQKLRTRVRWLHRSCLFLGQCHRGRYVCCWFCGNGASPDVGKHTFQIPFLGLGGRSILSIWLPLFRSTCTYCRLMGHTLQVTLSMTYELLDPPQVFFSSL